MNKELIIEEPKIPTWLEPKSINDAKLKIISLGQNMSEHAYIIGKILIWVKENLEYGKFQDWVDNNLWFAERTARKFMEFAKEADEKGKLPKRIYEIKELKSAESAVLGTPKLPEGKFTIFLADPPWQFDNAGFTQSAASHYPTMSTEEICNMKIPDISKKDAILFLWATNAMIQDALLVMKSWGFEYKSNLVWVKSSGVGIGWFVDSRHELLLIGVKGQGLHPEWKPISWQSAEKTRHSKKPELFYEIIEKMYPRQKYIELFLRGNPREGWSGWGNEMTI